jgi:transposase InsO family protein
MLKKTSSEQTTLEMVTLEGLVPKDHLLRKIDGVFDFTFIRDRFGAFTKEAAKGLKLRHGRHARLRRDNGSQYVAHDFQAEIGFLGIESSPSFVRVSEGNGCAERFIRTLKENLIWARTFDTVEGLRQAFLDFRRRDNEEWILERHGYRTSAQVPADQIDSPALAA